MTTYNKSHAAIYAKMAYEELEMRRKHLPAILWAHAAAYYETGTKTALDVEDSIQCWPTAWTFPS